MTCRYQELIQLEFDGELDARGTLEVERHVAQCDPCAEIQQNLSALRSAMHESQLYQKAPARFTQQVSSSFESKIDQRFRISPWTSRLLAVAAVIVVGVGAVGLLLRNSVRSTGEQLILEAVSDHVRSLQASHLIDVPSSNTHTVKPWFNGKLDFAPRVIDLSADGFALEGGRLDYLDGRPVAAIVYRAHNHPINLFIWPATKEANLAPVTESRNGYQIIRWTDGGINHCAVSDLNQQELSRFTLLLRQHAGN